MITRIEKLIQNAVIMTFHSKVYAALFSLFLSGCINKNIPPISPTYPFKIQGYSIFIDDEPGSYDVITIDTQTYCYFWKKTEDGDELFMEDQDCDLDSDRVLVLSENEIIVAADTKNLEDKVVGMLNYVLLNHKKTIVNNSKNITIF